MKKRTARLLRRLANRIDPLRAGHTHHVSTNGAEVYIDGAVITHYIDGAAAAQAPLRHKRRNGGRDLGLSSPTTTRKAHPCHSTTATVPPHS